jgi:hypothetical protein
MNFATWKLPEDISASKQESIDDRIKHYRFKINHCLNDGTRVIPTIPTAKAILDCYNQFELKLAIDLNSYTVYVD